MTHLKSFTEKMQDIWQEDLISIVAYGSFVGEKFAPRTSDINLVVLVKEVNADNLLISRRMIQHFHHKIRLVPLFLSVDFFRSSWDSFALEWNDVKSTYRILYGEDLIKDIKVEESDLRLQLEREIKENLVRFQQGLLFGLDITALLLKSAKSFRLHLKTSQNLKLSNVLPDTTYLERIAELRRKRLKYGRSKWEDLAKEHLANLIKFAKSMEGR